MNFISALKSAMHAPAYRLKAYGELLKKWLTVLREKAREFNESGVQAQSAPGRYPVVGSRSFEGEARDDRYAQGPDSRRICLASDLARSLIAVTWLPMSVAVRV
jgi:hypothetical protein